MLSTAPDFRFGKSFIIIGATSPLLFLKFNFNFSSYSKSILFSIIIIILSILLFDSFSIKNNGYTIMQIVSNNSKQLIKPKIIERPINTNYKTYKIGTIDIYMPAEELEEDRCFDHCLPCSPYYINTVVIRNKTLQSGFMHIKK